MRGVLLALVMLDWSQLHLRWVNSGLSRAQRYDFQAFEISTLKSQLIENNNMLSDEMIAVPYVLITSPRAST